MKMGLRFNGLPEFYIKYTPTEWAELESRYGNMGLKKQNTDKLWGMQAGAFFKETNRQIKSIVENTLWGTLGRSYRIVDDINRPFMPSGQEGEDWQINIAIFRVAPDESMTVAAPLPKFLTVAELNHLTDRVCKIFDVIINLALVEEVEVDVQESGS